MRPLSNSAGCPDAMDPERGSVGSGAVVALYRTVAGRVPVWKCRAGTFWGNQGLTGALRFRWLLPSLTAQLRAAALGVRRCIGYYLRAKTQLPPYGGLQEFELKCLRSHPTLLRFYPQALSEAPVLS